MSPPLKPATHLREGCRFFIDTPAKVNLSLKITGIRADGYHTLESLFCGIDLFDTLELRLGGKRLTVSCTDSSIPHDSRNLALAAAHRFYRDVPAVEGMGLAIHITKRIPVGAGLGGGSSNAAGVLYALNHIHHQPLPSEQLSALGLELGADVPFFLFGRPAWATGIGETLTAAPQLPGLSLLVVYPGVSISTRTIYQGLNLGLTKRPKQHRNSPFKANQFSISRDLVNDLEGVTLRRYPAVKEVKNTLSALGARGVLMSGSGSAVFGIFAGPWEVMEAEKAVAANRTWRTFAVKLLTEGPYLRVS
jgi:4-diphosphocytidyl-2-C-methyl-D-erythritol kinase